MELDNKRIVWIDWAKSLCMFLVILGHCHIVESSSFIKQFIYSFHMMFFFFLSGILCKRSLSLVSLKKDIYYIIIPYFTYGLIIIVFSFMRSRSFDYDILLYQIKLLLVGNDASIGPIWFLPALFICKQIFLMMLKVKNYYRLIYYLFLLFSFLTAHFVSFYELNIPMYADSALLGLPFFIIGNESITIWKRMKNISYWMIFVFAVLGGLFAIILSKYNGFVSMADCVIGNSLFLYYLNAFLAIGSLSLFCTMLSYFRLSFVTITSYGSIVTLGLHGIPLSLLNYYLPIFLGLTPSVYSFMTALVFASITYYICYLLIMIINKHVPFLFGLKGLSLDYLKGKR